jgi:GntR family transcriptional regulator, rspAB operon transcriptional repressor
VQAEHVAILDAVRQRSPDGAQAAMRHHIESFRSNVTRFL